MNVREPGDYWLIRRARQRRHWRRRTQRLAMTTLALVAALVLVAYISYAQALPVVQPHLVSTRLATQKVNLVWPAAGEAAVGFAGQGVLATSGPQVARPTASVAKIMLALMVLKKYPLAAGQSGPLITVTPADVQLYNQYLSQGGSVLKVQLGEQLSEYQALQAALLPSANNIADMLAVWAYGSMNNYWLAANQMATSLNMSASHFAGDASGFLPDTTSTPQDLVLLGQTALQNPVLAQIARQATADLPIAGPVNNVNWLLGKDGVIGLKTGNTDQAGGVFLVAASRLLPSAKTVVVVAAVMNSPTLETSMTAGDALINSVYAGFGNITALRAGQVVATYKTAWSQTPIEAVAAKDLVVVGYLGNPPTVKVNVKNLTAPVAGKASIGTASIDNQAVPVKLAHPLTTPSTFWRVWRH